MKYEYHWEKEMENPKLWSNNRWRMYFHHRYGKLPYNWKALKEQEIQDMKTPHEQMIQRRSGVTLERQDDRASALDVTLTHNQWIPKLISEMTVSEALALANALAKHMPKEVHTPIEIMLWLHQYAEDAMNPVNTESPQLPLTAKSTQEF